MTLIAQLRTVFIVGDLGMAIGLAVLAARHAIPAPAGYFVAAGWALLAVLIAVPWELAVRPLAPGPVDDDPAAEA